MLRRLLPLLLLTACSYFQEGAKEGNIVAPSNFKAGSGIIQSVSVLTNANKDNAKPGPRGRRPDPHLYRLALIMDASGYQTVDVDNGAFWVGEAVELTNDGRILRVSGTTFNELLGR
jgi:hypothetical protein